MWTKQQYSASHFSGTNITLSIGPSILTQAFSIEWSVSQNKVPIYGYNDQLYSGFAKGIVQVNGRLFINFVSPRYLTVTLQRYHLVMNAFRRGIETGSIHSILSNNQETVNLLSALTRHLSIPTSAFPLLNSNEASAHRGTGTQPLPWQINTPSANLALTVSPDSAFNNTSQEDLSSLLDEFFASDQAVSGLEQMLWGDNPGQLIDGSAALVTPGRAIAARQWSIDDLLSIDSGSVGACLSHESSYGRPDNIGAPIDGINGIDITIVYGSAYASTITNTSFHYDHSAIRVIKGVQFTSESESIMADGNPIMDAYGFFARNVYSVNKSY